MSEDAATSKLEDKHARRLRSHDGALESQHLSASAFVSDPRAACSGALVFVVFFACCLWSAIHDEQHSPTPFI